LALLVDQDEKVQAATVNLRAARKAKASTAYASACVYLAAGMALLDERNWASHYDLMFSLCLERAECEFLRSNFGNAEQLIVELLQRGVSKVNQAAVYHLKVLLHIVKSENTQAVDSALTCLRLFDIDIPAHPTREQVEAEYETLWQNLKGRQIEDLIDLPLMTDPELQGGHTGTLGPALARVPHRRQLVLPAPVPHGEHQRAAPGKRCVRARLWLFRIYPRPRFASL
jgi:predicted ATPase